MRQEKKDFTGCQKKLVEEKQKRHSIDHGEVLGVKTKREIIVGFLKRL